VFFDGILIVVGSGTGGGDSVCGQNICGILNVLPYRARIKRHMDKWSQQADSTHQIGQEAHLVLFLISG
jgi:hypothetical protein